MPTKSTIYDKIPYESNPFRQSHPDRLSSIASLFGLGTPALDDCRVLELGCSMGNNLLPIAQRYPGARCLGIDSSKHQIEVANQPVVQTATIGGGHDLDRVLRPRFELMSRQLVLKDCPGEGSR